jgi:beta-lactamase regulating signal transducer with metallopeptidase domain
MMTAINELIAPLVEPVTWALVHFTWQGSVVALALSAALALQHRSSAVTRYRTACCALLLMVVLPIATAVTYDGPQTGVALIAETSGPISSAPAPQAHTADGAQITHNSDSGTPATAKSRLHALLPSLEQIRPWLFGLWLVGVLALSLFHVAGWRRVQSLKHDDVEPAPEQWQEMVRRLCTCMAITRTVRVLKSACVTVPTVIGWLSPAVLIPVGAFTGLAPEQLRDVLVHELAHIKRRDYVVNLLQVVAETLLFFHPAVWWVSRMIREERENCCDDAVVVMSEDRLAYAKALVRLEEIRLSGPALAMRADGGSLVSRIRRLSGGDNMKSRHNRPLLTGVLLASLLIASGAALSLAIDRPGMGKDKKGESTAEVAGSYKAAEKNFEIEGRWEIERFGDVTVLQVKVRERKNRMSMSIHLDEDQFVGLDYGDDDEFILARDAGTFYFVGDFDGKGKKLEGDGKFGFVPNDDFEDKVDGNFDDHELFILAAKDVGFEYIEQMEKLGYDIDDGDDLVPLAIHGVSLDYVRELRESGYEVSLDALVRFRIHGVDPDFVREMADLGYDDLPADELVRFRIHGVSPEFVHGMHEAGIDHISTDDLTRMRIHGVSPEFVRGMHEAGIEHISTDDLTRMRIHGVSPDFVNDMHRAGVDHMSTDDLTRMRIHGVSPEFVRQLNELGYSDIDIDDLVRMRIHGVTPSYIKRVLDKTKEPPDVDTLIKMRIHGIKL